MKEPSENNIKNQLVESGDFSRGLPFYGSKGDFNFTTGRSQFTPGIAIKLVPLKDLSVHGDPGYSELDMSINKLKRFFKPGDRVRGIVVNSQLSSENGRTTVGKLYKVKPDYTNNSIRAWIKDPKTLKVQEIYPETLERLYESSEFKALSFTQFINS